jgi:heptosyltransferase-3
MPPHSRQVDKAVLSGGAQITHNADVTAVQHGAGSETVDLVGRVSLAELAAVIGRAALYVGVDTGVSHIAAATGTPVVVLFGPSNPIAWGPCDRLGTVASFLVSG